MGATAKSRQAIVALAVVLLSAVAPMQAQNSLARSRILAAPDENRLTTLRRNTHPLARAEFERGAAPADLPMERMQLVLLPSSAQAAALEILLKNQQDPASPQYHQWLTPREFGERFGASAEDIQKISAWLEGHGLHIDTIANGRNWIDFSGTAGQVQEAFHTAIHRYVVGGQSHWANSGDYQIPAALAPVVAGVATMHNFGKRTQVVRSNASFEAQVTSKNGAPQFSSSNGGHYLTPADYAVIYNINPLYTAGINGAGSTIAVVARSNINLGDVVSFRKYFGLSDNQPHIILNGRDPGILGNGEVDEAVLDASWAGAIAPGATVDLVVSASTNAADGVDLSEQYIIDNNLADVMTESFGECELYFSAAQAAYISNMARQAAAQGITYVVSTGDSGAEGCDGSSQAAAINPLSVNMLAATQYNIAVGGTMFNENGNNSLYWAPSNNPAFGSALTYIPEKVWNESCSVANCGASGASLWSGGGGASAFIAKPSWQSGVAGIPNDGARDLPDISLTASLHDAYLICLNNSCTPSNAGWISFAGYGGTSASAPSFAGAMALTVEKTGTRQGQAAPVLYKLAASESFAQCNGSNTAGSPASNCIFNDVTAGNNAVPGEAGYGTNSASYQAGTGYDLASGLGSVNVTNLVNQWTTAGSPALQIRVKIDSPSAVNAMVAGVTQFNGWAITDGGSITKMAVLVDGAFVANATYGVARPDVCNLYPGRAGCPNVGWFYAMDTAVLANGPHTLSAMATSNTGQQYAVSTPFTVTNWTTANPMRINIDYPSSAAVAGTQQFFGWAIDDLAAISQVALALDGVPLGNASYGSLRADVCAAYPNRIGCPYAGWFLNVNTNLLAEGTHTLAVTATSSGSQTSTVTHTFSVANQAASPLLISIDQPNSQAAPVSGTVEFFGWAISSVGAVKQVQVSVDGAALGNTAYGSPRPDVCGVFPGRAGCPNVGWYSLVDTTVLANGPHKLTVTASATGNAASGSSLTLSSSFTVANSNSGPTKVTIESPNSQSSTVMGLIPVYGAAANSRVAIKQVSILVDGVFKGYANYGSADAGSSVGGPYAPNVGWTYSLDTNALANGAHTLEVIALATDNTRASATAAFNAANWTGANPLHSAIDNPVPNGNLSGKVYLWGWAIDDLAAIANVSVAIDGVSKGNAFYGASRPDVCAVYAGLAGCPNVGWNFLLDTATLADGVHSVEVTTKTVAGQFSTISSSFNVSNAANNPVVVTIDTPSAGDKLTGSRAHIDGWALDTTTGVAVSSVAIFIDGVAAGSAVEGSARPDVCVYYPATTACPNVGWHGFIDTTALANGVHTLQITAVAADGSQRTVGTTFNPSNLAFSN